MCSATICPHPSARNLGVPTRNHICLLTPPAAPPSCLLVTETMGFYLRSALPSCPGVAMSVLAFPKKSAVSTELSPGLAGPHPWNLSATLHPTWLFLSLKASSPVPWASQVMLVLKNPPANEGEVRDMSSIPGLGRFPGGGCGNPLQDSCLDAPMDKEAWWARIHRITKSRT